ncbi:transcriptional regulator, HxlR family [Chitinophaga sp. YR573]|nr:transcriptional regulator, HxlR family [Chitinophaga sp. YR573]
MGAKKTKIRTNNNCSELLSLTLVKEMMQLLSGKWKMQIVTFLLENGKTHFMDLQRGVEGISATVLSKELQELQQSEIVARRVLNTKLISVEYELTKHGKTLESLVLSIASWGAAHRKHQHDNSQQV